jgi:AcrR family transcriptional regulator
MESVDGRHQRGERTRRAVAARAVALASTDGLAGMTIGQIASDLDIPKSSVQVAFPRKEDLQLATIAAATNIFVTAVVAPAQSQPKGLPRLVALIDSWVLYISNRVLPGGCFMGATFAEFDSKPGPVRDALASTANSGSDLSRLKRRSLRRRTRYQRNCPRHYWRSRSTPSSLLRTSLATCTTMTMP